MAVVSVGKSVGPKVTVVAFQGVGHRSFLVQNANLDPMALLTGGAALDREVDAVLASFSEWPFIFKPIWFRRLAKRTNEKL